MNIELLRKVQDAILLNPWAFDMAEWKGSSDVSPCGSTVCIAGWAAVITNHKKRPSEISSTLAGEGVDDLELDKCGDQVERLCLSSFWPDEYRVEYWRARQCNNHEAAALIAAARIEHFIATEGRE